MTQETDVPQLKPPEYPEYHLTLLEKDDVLPQRIAIEPLPHHGTEHRIIYKDITYRELRRTLVLGHIRWFFLTLKDKLDENSDLHDALFEHTIDTKLDVLENYIDDPYEKQVIPLQGPDEEYSGRIIIKDGKVIFELNTELEPFFDDVDAHPQDT